jgi:hypothetical protein
MLQLASKTGATLAGNGVPLSQEPVPTALYHHVALIILSVFPVVRFGKMRIGFQRFGICCQGTP